MYRPSRNIEASTIQKVTDILTSESWNNVSVEKTFSRVYNKELPIVCVRIEDTIHNFVEIGSHSTQRTALVLLDIFADNDGQRLDLKDALLSNLKTGWTYYEYVISEGKIISKIAKGKLSVTEIHDTPLNFNVDKSNLAKHDRYRHLISLNVKLSQVEE